MLQVPLVLLLGALCGAVPRLNLVSWTPIPDGTLLRPFRGTADRMALDIDESVLYIIGERSHDLTVLDIKDRSSPVIRKTIEFNELTDGIPTGVAVCRNQATGVKELAVTLRGESRNDQGHLNTYQLWEPFETGMAPSGRVTTYYDPVGVKYSDFCAQIIVICAGYPGLQGSSVYDPLPHVDIHTRTAGGWSTKFLNFLNTVGVSNARHIFKNADQSTHSIENDLEPSDLAISGSDVYISLYKNNAIAKFSLNNPDDPINIYGLGVQDWNNHDIDVSDREAGSSGTVNMGRHNIRSFLQPKRIDIIQYDGTDFLVTANTGGIKKLTAAVDGVDFDESTRARQMATSLFDPADTITIADKAQDSKLGRLYISKLQQESDGWNTTFSFFNNVHAYGTRSWSLFNGNGITEVFDSGSTMGYEMSQQGSSVFNGDCFGNSNSQFQHFDTRSDDFGIEPTAVAHTTYQSNTLVAIGSGRSGGIWLYEVGPSEAPQVPTGIFRSYQRFGPSTGTWLDTYNAGTAGVHYIQDLIFYSDGTSVFLAALGSQIGAVAIFQVVDGSYP